MVQHSELNPRDHAIVLILRDSGCRLGGLCSNLASSLYTEQYEDGDNGLRIRGRVNVQDEKLMKSRFI